ncbi:MAG: inorganic diphosphatase [Candidatus Buchananbacteria bacterium]
MNESESKVWLRKKVKVLIDRALGTVHPKYEDMIYPVNYGFVPNTISEIDHEEIDAYVLGPTEPLAEFEGEVIAVIEREGDEIKLLVSDGRDFSDDEIRRLTDFQEKFFKSVIIR